MACPEQAFLHSNLISTTITGPICSRAANSHAENELSFRGHHDWPVISDYRRSSYWDQTARCNAALFSDYAIGPLN